MAGNAFIQTVNRPANSESITVIALELFGVWLFTLLAGASDDAGKIMVLFMVGLWLIFLVKNQSAVSNLATVYTNIANGNDTTKKK